MDELVVDVSVGEGVTLPLPVGTVEEAVRHTLRAEGHQSAEISIALVADEEIAELNQDYLDHEGPTDVISFALHERGEPPLGDVYVGVPQALRQAAELGVEPGEEVLRLAIHGTLHVLGYEHPDGEERTESEMFHRQEEILRAVLASGGTAS